MSQDQISKSIVQAAHIIAAWCCLRQDFRHFRLDRILRAELTDQAFHQPHQTLAQRWIERCLASLRPAFSPAGFPRCESRGARERGREQRGGERGAALRGGGGRVPCARSPGMARPCRFFHPHASKARQAKAPRAAPPPRHTARWVRRAERPRPPHTSSAAAVARETKGQRAAAGPRIRHATHRHGKAAQQKKTLQSERFVVLRTVVIGARFFVNFSFFSSLQFFLYNYYYNSRGHHS
jgi:hypothetical protein